MPDETRPVKVLCFRMRNGEYIPAKPNLATHIRFHMPGPCGKLMLPVCRVTKVDKAWLWNGDIYAPTLKPSLLTTIGPDEDGKKTICHTWITDGKVEYLSDCTHDLKGQTLDLLDIEPMPETTP